MESLVPVTLQGKRVVLEPLEVAHARELWPSASEREIWAFMSARVESEEDLAEWIAARVAEREAGTALPFLLRDAATRAAFGSSSLFDVSLPNRRVEIGHTWVGATHRRTGANTEAKLLLFAHAFDAMGANRVQLKTDARNTRSQRAIERIGATREGVLRQHIVMHDGFVRDSVMYSVVRAEWPSVRARLEGFLSERR